MDSGQWLGSNRIPGSQQRRSQGQPLGKQRLVLAALQNTATRSRIKPNRPKVAGAMSANSWTNEEEKNAKPCFLEVFTSRNNEYSISLLTTNCQYKIRSLNSGVHRSLSCTCSLSHPLSQWRVSLPLINCPVCTSHLLCWVCPSILSPEETKSLWKYLWDGLRKGLRAQGLPSSPGNKIISLLWTTYPKRLFST